MLGEDKNRSYLSKLEEMSCSPGVPWIGAPSLPQLLQVQRYLRGWVAVHQRDGAHHEVPTLIAAGRPAARGGGRQRLLHHRDQLMAQTGRVVLGGIAGLRIAGCSAGGPKRVGDRAAGAGYVGQLFRRGVAPVLASEVPGQGLAMQNLYERRSNDGNLTHQSD